MGRDKGLLEYKGQLTWAQHCYSLLAGMEIPVAISLNKSQYDQYKQIFPLEELIVDNDDLAIHGPLIGLLSAHINHPGKDIFVLACDMVAMHSVVLRYLQAVHVQHNKNKTCVFTHNNAPEPLCSIYTAHDLETIYQLHQQGSLQKHSLKYCIENLDTELLDISPEWEGHFKNFNTPV